MAVRWLARVAAAALVGALVVLVPSAATADWSWYRTGPHVGACWERVVGYGGVYQVSTMIVNDSPHQQTGGIQVHRPGTGLIQNESWTAAPQQWIGGPTAHVAIVPGDVFQLYLNGVRIAEIPQHGIPFYMSHCRVATSSSTRINQAVSYGLAQFGSYYTGCLGGDYRKGAVTSTNRTFDGRVCGQSWVYHLPAGGKGFDCSGLIFKMFQHAGVWFPYDSTSQMVQDRNNLLDPVPRSQIRTGDLVLRRGHVGMYVGHNWVLESSPDRGAMVDWVSGATRQVAESVQLSPLSAFPSSSYSVQRVRGT